MQNLRRIRHARGLTQKALSEMVGCNQATISKLERGSGKKNATLELVGKIADALQVSPVELFGLPQVDQRLLEALRRAPPERRAAILLLLQERDTAPLP